MAFFSPRAATAAASSTETLRTVICVTASNEKQAAAVEQELAARQQAGTYGPDVILFAVPDPSSARVGSGGATFNALITVQELLSSRADWSLDTCRVFMIHSGGDSQRLPCQSVCGKAWSALPTYNASFELDAPIDLLLHHMFRLFARVRAGLVIASSDVLLYVPDDFNPYWPAEGSTGLAIPTPKAYGPNHGVYRISADVAEGGVAHCRVVDRFFQKASVPELTAAAAVRPDDTVLLDTGIVYFSPPATLRLADLARSYPLDCCSYLGVDMNRQPLRIELYSDIMMAMGNGMGLTREQYHATATSDSQSDRIATARDILWTQLADVPLYALVVEGGGFSHVGTTLEYLQLLAAPTPFQARYALHTRAAWYEEGRSVSSTGSCDVGDDPTATSNPAFTVMNSLLHTRGDRGTRSVVEHSELTGAWAVGSGALVSSVRSIKDLRVRNGIAVQELRLAGGHHRVVTVLGCDDPIKDPYTKASARICGVKWDDLFARAGVSPADVWPGATAPASMTIWTAQLFPAFLVNAPPSAASLGSNAALQDRASLWLQWLLPALQAGDAAASSVPPPAFAEFVRDEVIATWRAARRLSLKDILGQADAAQEFAWRRALRGRVDVRLLVGAVAQGGNVCVRELVTRLGRNAVSLTGITAGVGSAIDSVAGQYLQLGGAAPSTPTGTLSKHGGGGFFESGRAAETVSPASFAAQALQGLDHIARTARVDIAGRALAIESALLWAMAGWGSAGYRSGPAHHKTWLPAFELLEGDYSAAETTSSRTAALDKRMRAVNMLATLRDDWMHRAHLIGRAARHYERASQLLTAQCIYTAPVQRPIPFSVPNGAWVYARAPARIDLAGGWSDTPPVTFEASVDGSIITTLPHSAAAEADPALAAIAASANRGGGLVVNVAIDVDGITPMGCRARKVTTLGDSPAVIVIRTRSMTTSAGAAAAAITDRDAPEALGEVISTVEITRLEHLRDYNQPHAEGALVKCVLLCLGAVQLPRGDASDAAVAAAQELSVQLQERIGGRLEVETWSNLPQGSGLGTSSILAGTVIAAISQATGMKYDHDSLDHLVLKVEQMLSTGGGWQDQVGGLWPGVKVSACNATLPVSVTVTPLASTVGGSSLEDLLDAHVFLLYTGKTRLAKNLLQRVLRQWALRENDVTQLVADLRRNAVNMAGALKRGSVADVGAALVTYWSQKKLMAPMAEPEEVTLIISCLSDILHGAALCGAGGGGFLVCVTREPYAMAAAEARLRADPDTASLVWSAHKCSVNKKGLDVYVRPAGSSE